jgi:DNA invertase Pin-like site-specific DNA recombinase
MELDGFLRVSTDEQGEKGHSLADQETQLRNFATANGHTLRNLYVDIVSSGNIPKLVNRDAAIADIEAGNAQGLICKDLDRLSRGLLDGATILDRANRKGWTILTLDGTDTRNAETQVITGIKLVIAQEEKRKISKRTKDGLAAAKAKGIVLGRPRMVLSETVSRILDEHSDGKSFYAIAKMLNSESIPTPTGNGSWYPATVRDIVLRANGN